MDGLPEGSTATGIASLPTLPVTIALTSQEGFMDPAVIVLPCDANPK
jgi:hypothetical protein